MKKSINGIGTIVLIMLVSIFIASCDYFNRPMLDYLEEWTNTAQVSKHTFDDTYPVIGDITNIPSGKDRVITYYLINPQNYTLDSSVTFAHDDSLVVNNKIPSDFATVEQDATDKSIIRLTLKDSVGATGILPLDGDGTEITPTITIREPNSGRFFGSYTVPVRVNSLPPRLFNAVIMKYRDSNEKYAVCFSLPAMGAGDIHRDITQITVNGTFNGQPFNNTYQVTGGGTGTVTVDGVPESSSSDYRAIGSDFADTGNTFVGIKTGLDLGPTTPTCTITLTDSSGATTVTTVSTVSTLLNKIYVNENSGDDNNTGTVSSPVKTIGNALEKLRDVPKGNVILQSDISLTGEVTVGSGISVTVTSDGSERTVINGAGRVFSVTSSGSLIIGGNITLTGTNAGGNGGAVYVNGGTFTMEADSKITGSSADYGGAVYVDGGTFTMESGSIITGSSAGYAGGGVSVSGGEFIMRGGTIGGNDPGSANTASYDGGGVYVDGGTFTLSGGTISGNSSSRNGGGVYIDSGTFTMSDTATIQDNTATTHGGGVHIFSGGTFTMNGGTIGGTAANTAEYGGGVFVSGGTFNMNDGTISGNTVTQSGGGVYVNDGNFTMKGGTIGGTTANTATQNGGGVYVFDGTFSVSGSPTITGNTVSNNANNVYLPSGKTITIGADGLIVGTIGVTAADMKAGGAAQITGTDVTGAANIFTSDISLYSIEENIATTDGGIAVFLSDTEVFYQETDASARSAGTFADAVSEANTWTSGGTITLMKNIDGNNAVFGTDGVSTPIIFRGGTCTLDLNGYDINRGLTSARNEGQVIIVRNYGDLTIKDSSAKSDGTGGTGKITGGYNDGDQDNGGGGIYVESGSLTLESGSITGNKTLKDGGGVYVGSGCTFTLSGGTISGNSSSRNGGGVYVGGTFTLGSSGIGIWGDPINDMSIQNNTNSNVYLPSGKKLSVNSPERLKYFSLEIGITLETGTGIFTEKFKTNFQVSEDDVKKWFKPDQGQTVYVAPDQNGFMEQIFEVGLQ